MEKNINCFLAVPKICKGDCCGPVIIEKLLFEVMKSENKIITPPEKIEEVSDSLIIPVTESGKCCFLTKDFRCNIYEYRPEVCRRFGLIPEMLCPHISLENNLRSPEEKREVEESNKNYQIAVMGKILERLNPSEVHISKFNPKDLLK